MARQARGKSMDPTKVQVFHITQRCVRRAFLCGDDAVSGKSYAIANDEALGRHLGTTTKPEAVLPSLTLPDIRFSRWVAKQTTLTPKSSNIPASVHLFL